MAAGRLAGRTALVTGAAKRLGRACALALARAGADVIIHYRRSEEEAAAVAEGVREAGRRAWTLQADLADTGEAAELMGRAVEAAGAVDILLNNASAFTDGRITEATAEEILSSVSLHAVAPLLLSRALAAQGRGGHVVNFLDTRVADYDREHAAYHLGKRMLFTLTRMLALELAPAVAVNAVAPGLILPPPGKDQRFLRDMARTNPMNRHGDADDVVQAVLFFLASPFITGQVIFVDGGRHMKGRVYG
jgi:hypothetical protein